MKHLLLMTVLLCSCSQDGDWAKGVSKQVKANIPEATLLRTTHHDFSIGHMIFATPPVDVELWIDNNGIETGGTDKHKVALVNSFVFYRDENALNMSLNTPYSLAIFFFSLDDSDLYWKVPMLVDWKPNPEYENVMKGLRIYTALGLSDRIVPGAALQFSQPLQIGSIAADDDVTAKWKWSAGPSFARNLRTWAVEDKLPNGVSIDDANKRLNELASE